MQSQLEPTLPSQDNATIVIDEDDNDEPEDVEEVEDEEDHIRANECDIDSPTKPPKNASVTGCVTGKVVTLQMLLAVDILRPGKGVMTIEYLGQKFVGNLLEDGKIQSQETDIIFASPSAWAFACKRFINPIKKSGCGWSSVKYQGKKLEVYKNLYFKRKKDLEERDANFRSFVGDMESLKEEVKVLSDSIVNQSSNNSKSIIVKHNTIANRMFTHDANTMIECVPFASIGKIQPFLITLSTNAALLIDFHCHLTTSEVSGYLAGHWDVNTHNLQILRAYPCCNTKNDRENASQTEGDVGKAIDREKLQLVGWYHSHPFTAASPTLRDVDAQLDYQIRMKGSTDNSYTPCIGLIVTPYNVETSGLDSIITAYWVVPPPENKPNEYGRPMAMSFSVTQDGVVGDNNREDMKRCVEYYSKQSDYINFKDIYKGTSTYLEKLRQSLFTKFPRNESDTTIWGFVREIIGFPVEEETVISIPTVAPPKPVPPLAPPPPVAMTDSCATPPTLNPPTTISPNLMLTSDIANALFSSGKFPNASSLLGLPDPMAHSTLAANNMFLSSNLFKMQELLKPMSGNASGNPVSAVKTTEPLKIPNDKKLMPTPPPPVASLAAIDFSKLPKLDFSSSDAAAAAAIKSTFSNFAAPMKTPSATDLITSKSFSVADLSISSVPSSRKTPPPINFSLDLSNRRHADSVCERPAKIAKTDMGVVDMTFNHSDAMVTDLSTKSSVSEIEKDSFIDTQDQPMNLAS